MRREQIELFNSLPLILFNFEHNLLPWGLKMILDIATTMNYLFNYCGSLI